MQISDNVYGRVEIQEPVLVALMQAPPVLRLKKISQYGVPDKYYHHKNFSRYKHGVGVMLLLRRLGASLEEQVAGLLHDVSHLAFSHVSDWVFGGGREGKEDFHEGLHEDFIKKTEIAKILKKYNFDVSHILDERNFPLLEKEIPDLCADRIDYILQELHIWADPSNCQLYLNELLNFDDQIVFKSKDAARKFAKDFLFVQTTHWGGFQAVMRYHIFAKALELAVENNVLSKDDFYQDEEQVLQKIESGGLPAVQELLKVLLENRLAEFINKTGQKIYKKFRHVDPKILLGGQLVRLSELDSGFKELLEEYREINSLPTIV